MGVIDRALDFVNSLVHPDGGLRAWPGHSQYNECTGYMIPTLQNHYRWGIVDKAARWLIGRQNPEGSWDGIDGKARTFDTAACVEGLRAVDYMPGAVEAAMRGEDWLRSMRRNDGVMRVTKEGNENRCYTMRASGIIRDDTPADYWMKVLPDLTGERSHYIAYCLEGLWLVGKHDYVRDFLKRAYQKFGPIMPMHWNTNDEDRCAIAQFGVLRSWASLDCSGALDALHNRMESDGSINLALEHRVRPIWVMKYYLDLEWEAMVDIEPYPVNAVAVVVGIDHWGDITGPFVASLIRHNPGLPVLVIDNASKTPYPIRDEYRTLRLPERVGYNLAMNAAIKAEPGRDWYILFNNDCLCHSNFSQKIAELDNHTVYGSGWNKDAKNNLELQWSAWLCLSKRALREVGRFDKRLSAGYEDFDYELRALKKGFKLDTWDIPVVHLDKHTRFMEPNYYERWKKSRDLFMAEHGIKL